MSPQKSTCVSIWPHYFELQYLYQLNLPSHTEYGVSKSRNHLKMEEFQSLLMIPNRYNSRLRHRVH